ncbi:hypothetical protein JCM30760_26850 [Thiomicrorhabdus hydrogeniphila]
MNKDELVKDAEEIALHIQKLSKKKGVPSEFLASLVYDRASDKEKQEALQRYVNEFAEASSRGRTPGWIKIAIGLLAEEHRIDYSETSKQLLLNSSNS